MSEVAIKVTQIYLHSRVFKGYSKDMIVSDCLSRSSLQQIDCKIENEVNLYVDSVSAHMPISDTRLKMIYNATQNDSEIQQVISLMARNWEKSVRFYQ